MSLPEIFYRIKKYFQSVVEFIGIRSTPTSVMLAGFGKGWINTIPSSFHISNYRNVANKILAGEFNVFSMLNAKLGFPPNWNRDPETGIVSPIEFGKFMNYRDFSKYGNIKFLWEINRHSEVVTLAQAYYLTKDLKYLDGIQTLLDSWFDQSPYLYGLNWSSPIEAGIRLTNWAVCWHLIGGEHSKLFSKKDGLIFQEKWLESVFQHSYFIRRNLSFYSSANNHLLAEYMGLFVASLVWPCWKESANWRSVASVGFESEIYKQNYADGVNKEQAIYYQHEVIDMMLIALMFYKQNGSDFNEEYYVQLEHMIEFISSMLDVNGHLPMIGDADDALIIKFSQEDTFSVYQSILATGAVLFEREDFAKQAKRIDDKTRWLLGDVAELKFNELLKKKNNTKHHQLKRKMSYPQGGYYFFGKDFGTNNEVLGVVDCGLLGFLSIAAHGHADALAFNLSVAGDEVLIDPGTYAYHTNGEWRKYFKGTSAHNTVRIDKQNQSEDGGNFLWLFKAVAKCELFEHDDESQMFIGTHNGYSRLNDPVKHTRKVDYVLSANEFLISDYFECKDSHLVELFWHFAEGCEISSVNEKVIIRSNNAKLEISMLNGVGDLRIYFGDEKIPLGWISRKFNHKVPCYTLVFSTGIIGSSEIVTKLKIID